MESISVLIKIFLLAAIAFAITIAWTPFLTNFLYRYRIGKTIRKAIAGLHGGKAGTPTMGGVLIWMTTAFLALGFWILAELFPESVFSQLNFLTRRETLLPLGALVASGVVGAVDDLLDSFRKRSEGGGGLRIRERLLIYATIAALGAWWFFFKLDWDLIHIPGIGDFNIGWWYIPLFIFVIVASAFSVNETDGLDGLAGGVLLFAFGAFGIIAFVEGKTNLAAFTAVIIGALLAFLWFNVHPARFFMGDTGSMSMGVTLGVVAMLTNSLFVLPLIGFVFVMESLSVILQMGSRRLFGRKIFKISPFHHHLEAIGWPESKVTMRLWIIAAVTAFVGLVIGLVGRGT